MQKDVLYKNLMTCIGPCSNNNCILSASLLRNKTVLIVAIALIGLRSVFVILAAVSITSELFGPNSAGVNHYILIKNIPLESLLCGLLTALVYEANIENSNEAVWRMVCMGRNCYFQTFVWWGCISLLGLAYSSSLFLRTKARYEHFTKYKHKTSFELLTTYSSYDGNWIVMKSYL